MQWISISVLANTSKHFRLAAETQRTLTFYFNCRRCSNELSNQAWLLVQVKRVDKPTFLNVLSANEAIDAFRLEAWENHATVFFYSLFALAAPSTKAQFNFTAYV